MRELCRAAALADLENTGFETLCLSHQRIKRHAEQREETREGIKEHKETVYRYINCALQVWISIHKGVAGPHQSSPSAEWDGPVLLMN